MGLDVYLYRYIDKQNTDERESKYSEFTQKLWKDAGNYDDISDEKKEEINTKSDEYAQSLGLDEYGEDKLTKFKIEINSTKYPEHMFKIGYFRSSYNSGGTNRVLKNLGLKNLGEIFEVNGDYCVQPDWERALINIQEVIDKFKSMPSYRSNVVFGNIFKDITVNSEEEALKKFMEEMNRENAGTYNYSNSVGEFYLSEPLKVLAIIPGTFTMMGERPCTYVITESDNSWYLEALEIVKETIEYVLQAEDKSQYYLHWSS